MNNKLLLLLFSLDSFSFCSQVGTGKQKENRSARSTAYTGSMTTLTTRPATNNLGLF